MNELESESSLFAQKKGWRRYIGPKRIFIIFVFALLAGFAWHYYDAGLLALAPLQAWMATYPRASIVLFVFIYSIITIVGIPAMPFNLLAGVFWGGWLGGVIATAGSGLGAVGAFYIARLIFGQPLARKFDHRIVSWLQKEFDEKGWRFIAFVRINPIFPTGPVNYIFGLTSVRAWTYTWATVAFLLPPSVAIAVLGNEIGTFVLDGGNQNMMKGVLAVSAAITILVGMRFVGKYLNERRQD